MSLFDHLGDQSSNLRLVSQVANDDIDLAPERLDLIVRLLVLGRTLDEDEVSSCPGQGKSHRGADSPGGSRDQGRLAREREEMREVVSRIVRLGRHRECCSGRRGKSSQYGDRGHAEMQGEIVYGYRGAG